MIAHDGPKLNPKLGHSIKDARSYLRRILIALGVPRLGISHKPSLGHYKLAEPIEPVIRPKPFDVAVRYRGTDPWGNPKRVDPATERRRLRSAS